MSELSERDAARAELGLEIERVMAVVHRLDNDELSNVVADFYQSLAAFLEAQTGLFDSLATETLRRVTNA